MTAMYRRDDNTSFAAQLANNNVACRLLLSSNIKVELTNDTLPALCNFVPLFSLYLSLGYFCRRSADSCVLLKTSLLLRYILLDFHNLV